MKIGIIDNERVIREGIEQLLPQTGVQISAISSASSIQSGIDLINDFRPNILLLDVELDEGTGFDLLQQLPDIDFVVIFITAHQKYALQAFKIGAIDFIQKPILLEDLTSSLIRAKESVEFRDVKKQLSIVQQQLASLELHDQKIVLKDSKSMYFVKIQEIINCEAEGSYTTFNLLNGQKIVVSKSLKEFEELLSVHGFIRTHHSHLVNSKRILKIDRTDGGQLIMENGNAVPLSQRKREQILQFLAR